MADHHHDGKSRPLLWLRNSFLSGVAVVLPFAVTVWLLYSFVRFVDTSVAPLLPERLAGFAEAIPGVGLAVAVVALIVLGALAGNFLGRMLVREGERLVEQLPLVRSIYGGAKQVFKQVASPERQSFKEAVLIEFPRPGLWTIGFVTNDSPAEVTEGLGQNWVCVYVPQAPIPTTGFIMYAPRDQLRSIALGPEEALKRVLSLGSARPIEELNEAIQADQSALRRQT